MSEAVAIYPSVDGCREAVQGELMLCAAILRRAIYDMVLYKDDRRIKKRRMAVDAYHWMFESKETEKVHSFVGICHSLSMDPDWVRQRVRSFDKESVRKFDIGRLNK